MIKMKRALLMSALLKVLLESLHEEGAEHETGSKLSAQTRNSARACKLLIVDSELIALAIARKGIHHFNKIRSNHSNLCSTA